MVEIRKCYQCKEDFSEDYLIKGDTVYHKCSCGFTSDLVGYLVYDEKHLVGDFERELWCKQIKDIEYDLLEDIANHNMTHAQRSRSAFILVRLMQDLRNKILKYGLTDKIPF